MPEVAKLGHVALVTPDQDKSVWFFRDVLGLEEVEQEGDTLFLRAWGDFEHHTVSLRPGPEARVDHVGWRTRRAEDVDEFAQLLGEKGVELQRVEDGQERGQGRAVRFNLPASGHPFELYYDIEKPEAPEEKRSRLKNNAYRAFDHGISPRRIDHVNLWTDNPAPAAEFLYDALGFKAREVVKVGDALVGSWMAVTT